MLVRLNSHGRVSVKKTVASGKLLSLAKMNRTAPHGLNKQIQVNKESSIPAWKTRGFVKKSEKDSQKVIERTAPAEGLVRNPGRSSRYKRGGEMGPADIRPIVEEVARFLKRELEEVYGVMMHLQAPPYPVLAFADKKQLSQVLANLITASCESLRLHSKGQNPNKTIRIEMAQGKGCALIQICRTAKEETSNILSQVCEAFVQKTRIENPGSYEQSLASYGNPKWKLRLGGENCMTLELPTGIEA